MYIVNHLYNTIKTYFVNVFTILHFIKYIP